LIHRWQRSQLAELETNLRNQEARNDNVAQYEQALANVQQEVGAYQSVLAQTQVQTRFPLVSSNLLFLINKSTRSTASTRV